MSSFGLVLVLVLFSNYTTDNTLNKSKKVIGTWEYSIPDAPMEYQIGDLILEESDGELSGFTMISEYKTPIEKIVLDGKNLTFKMYVQSTEVYWDLEFDKKSFSGQVSYSEGDLAITGTRKSSK